MKITRMRLAILSILVVLTQRCSGEEEKGIDWTKCFRPDRTGENAETQCYVAKNCRIPGSSIENMVNINLGDELDRAGGKCDIGIQIKPLGKSKWLVYMQVKETQLELSEGVRLEGDNDRVIFGCKKTSNGIEYIGDDKLKIEKYSKAEDISVDDRIYCSFTITGKTDTLDAILLQDPAKLRFKFKSTVEKTYPMDIKLNALSTDVKDLKRCEPEDAKFDATYRNDSLIIHKITIEPSKNVCPSSESLFVQYPTTEKYVEATEVDCKFESGAYKFVYTSKQDNTPVSIPPGTEFHVHCAMKACTACTTLETSSDEYKLSYTAGDPVTGKCAEATCGKGKLWQNNWDYEGANGEKGIRETAIDCKKKTGGNTAHWFLKDSKGKDVEVKKASCSKQIDCDSKNQLLYECVTVEFMPKTEICVPPNMTATDFGCKDELKATVRGIGHTILKNLTCDHETGKWFSANKKIEVTKGSNIYCSQPIKGDDVSKGGGDLLLYGLITSVVLLLGLVGLIIYCWVRRHRKYTESEVEQRVRPRKKTCCFNWFYDWFLAEKLCTDDLAQVKEWTDHFFETVLKQWMKFSVYERKKFSERIGFELGVTSTAEQFFKLFSRIFEVETDYRIWQGVVPVFKLLHAQAADKENNLDTDKRMRKWCVSKCMPIVDKLGWDGCNNEWRDTAYQRYQIMNLLYYCDDKDFIEKLLEFFDKGQFHGLHSINRQVAWAAAVREKDQFEAAKKVAQTAFVDKAVVKALASKREKAQSQSSGGATKTKTKSNSDAASGNSSKSNKDKKAGSKEAVKGGSKESKSTASKEGSKSGKSNRSNKSKKDKKGSKETPSGKAKKGDSKESSKSSKRDKDKKDKGGSKEGKGKSGKGKRDKAGADDSGKEKKEPSDKDKKKKEPASDKDKKTKSGKDKKDASGKDKKDKSGKSGKDKKTTSGKEKKEGKSNKEKTAQSSKESKSGKSKKSSKEKKDGKSTKSSKEKTEKTAQDKTMASTKSKKSTKSTKNVKRNNKPGVKERKDADGDKLHGDRAQHIFFAIGSSRSKEQIASFLDYYIDQEDFDASNIVYLFAATLEWDDTRSYGLDLFLNMNKKVFKKMPPGDKYHMRILKNFRRYVIGELDLQKIQDHIVNDPNYTAKHYSALELSLMLKRIQNNVTFQPKMIDQLDEALKKLNF